MNYILEYKGLLLEFLLLLIIVISLIFILKIKNKKVKPIVMDDILDKVEEKSDLEQVIAALESSDDRQMTTFEEEQEANAIISYQELVEAVKEKKEKVQPKAISEETIVEVDIPEEPILEKAKFKNSEFISPIFGKDKTDDDFLTELKNFRSNL
ncbi:MAG: hypothetical protein RSB71_02285 [Bacilli bacterium]